MKEIYRIRTVRRSRKSRIRLADYRTEQCCMRVLSKLLFRDSGYC